MRPVVAVFVAGAVALGGAVILGEYPLVGATPLFAGPVFGIVVAEVLLSIGRADDRFLRVGAALITEAGLVWALWISTGHRLDLAAGTAWVGLFAGATAAALWLRTGARRGRSSSTSE